jgi:hypothetical protein
MDEGVQILELARNAQKLFQRAKCYMNMRPLYQPQVTQTEAVA